MKSREKISGDARPKIWGGLLAMTRREKIKGNARPKIWGRLPAVKICEKNKTAAVAVADEHVDEVANILGYKVLSSRRELCRDDMAW